jgi:hypothetical protein
MNSRLKILVGRSLRSVVQIHDYSQLYFDHGAVLNIYNTFSVVGTSGDGVEGLVGTVVGKVVEDREKAVLTFGTGAQISIDLRDAAYRGPEAMELIVPGEPTVVWN